MCTLHVTIVQIPATRFDIAVCSTVSVSKHKIKLVGYVAYQENVRNVL